MSPKTRSTCCATDGKRLSTALPCLRPDRKSTRLNSSHLVISYAVFCLKKKKEGFQTASIIRQNASQIAPYPTSELTTDSMQESHSPHRCQSPLIDLTTAT